MSRAVLLASLLVTAGCHREAEGRFTWNLIASRTSPKFEDITFVDSLTGWLASARGDLLATRDGGRTWVSQLTAVPSLRSVEFLDGRRGFAGSLAGQLLTTADGGITWTDITERLKPRPRGLCGITHVGGDIHMVGRFVGHVADYYRSSDGGTSWTHLDLSDLAQGLVDVAFLSPEVGLIGGMSRSPLAGQGDAIILKTDDGGQHWRIVFRGRHARGFAWKIFPMSSGLVFAALQSEDGLYEIAKSTDGGDRWETHTVSSDNPAKVGLQGVGFLDENTGWVGGFFDGMYATRDGGIHWEFVNIPGGRINRFERTGNTLITASSSGVLRTERVAPVP